MTNPNNAIGTNAAYGGRTSVNAFNDDLAAYNRGIMSGWQCVPNTGLTVSVGGVSGTRDVAIAEDNIGNKTTINNISFAPVNVSLAAAPVANSRIDLIVVYVDGSPDGTAEDVDNPSACGIISVKGTAAASPVEPSDSDIRDAITADGASGTTAYYTVLASVTIASGVTEITSAMISSGVRSELALIGAVVSEPTSLAYVDTVNIVDKAVTADKIDFDAFSTKVAGYNSENYSLTTSYQDIATISNVPAGTYLAIFDCSIHQEVGTTRNIIARLDTGVDGYPEIGIFNTFTGDVSYWTHLCGFIPMVLTANRDIKLQFKAEASWSMRQAYGKFLITRIG